MHECMYGVYIYVCILCKVVRLPLVINRGARYVRDGDIVTRGSVRTYVCVCVCVLAYVTNLQRCGEGFVLFKHSGYNAI